jgi:hypothetical protein
MLISPKATRLQRKGGKRKKNLLDEPIKNHKNKIEISLSRNQIPNNFLLSFFLSSSSSHIDVPSRFSPKSIQWYVRSVPPAGRRWGRSMVVLEGRLCPVVDRQTEPSSGSPIVTLVNLSHYRVRVRHLSVRGTPSRTLCAVAVAGGPTTSRRPAALRAVTPPPGSGSVRFPTSRDSRLICRPIQII